ncbi:MAG: RnfABCDGE type electron transport complex subunit D [bacterium]
MKESKLIVSASPHLWSSDTISLIMWDVVIALLPATIVGLALFGLPALFVTLTCIFVAVVVEGLCQRVMGRKVTIADGSAVVTGFLLALNLPSGAPLWMAAVGSVVAIIIGKQVYGGLGNNPFNPALVARVFLLISWPLQMTTWPEPTLRQSGLDAVTTATPLGVLKEKGIEAIAQIPLIHSFLGNVGGCIGEVSVLALLIGAIYLLWRGHITWHIPLTFIAGLVLFTGIFWLYDGTQYANPIYHILNGGLFLGAFFMATDMVTTPITTRGMIIFGLGCGLITGLIRLFGGYPEGVSFSILLMNAFTPLLDRWKFTHPTKYGEVKSGD